MKEDIRIPSYRMCRLSVIETTVLWTGICFLFSRRLLVPGIILTGIWAALLFPAGRIFRTRLKAVQSWMVYHAITSDDVSYREAMTEIPGRVSTLKRIHPSGITDLIPGNRNPLHHFHLPAAVVEQKSRREIGPEIEKLEDNMPRTLSCLTGREFPCDGVALLLAPVVLPLVLLFLSVGYLLTLRQGASFSPFLTIFILYLLSLAGGIFGSLSGSLKSIYYTVFYTAVNHREKLSPVMKSELNGFLNLGKESDTGTPEPDPLPWFSAGQPASVHRKGETVDIVRSR